MTWQQNHQGSVFAADQKAAIFLSNLTKPIKHVRKPPKEDSWEPLYPILLTRSATALSKLAEMVNAGKVGACRHGRKVWIRRMTMAVVVRRPRAFFRWYWFVAYLLIKLASRFYPFKLQFYNEPENEEEIYDEPQQ